MLETFGISEKIKVHALKQILGGSQNTIRKVM